MTTEANSLRSFLSKSKESYLRDVKEDQEKAAAHWTVVMGNEAGDLDSIASSIAFAWVQSEVNKKPAVPVMQVERDDLSLRAENLHALKMAGLSDTLDELLTLTELHQFKPFPAHKFALVDHNRLGDTFTEDNPKAEVVAILDHHQDEGLYPSAVPRVIAPCGSCASHVAAVCAGEIPPELATLLLTAIIIDTDGFRPGGKAVQVDRDAALSLTHRCTVSHLIPPPSALSPIENPNANPDALYEVPAIKELSKTLADKKSDVSHLGALDLLRRDYKEYSYKLSWATGQPTVKAGLSTVPTSLKAWATDGRLEKAAVEWMERHDLTILGVLTSFRDVKKPVIGKAKQGKHKREMAWIILEKPPLAKSANDGLTSEALARRIWQGLEADKEIDVKPFKKFTLEKSSNLPQNSKARLYKQGNAHATRKTTAPLLKKILESS
ncbi:DHH phosphoesterase [Agrocybe pediades]|nr:DHH phosphoesterase [Agrocybe pediades]